MRLWGVEIHERQRDVALDGHEYVVELMGNTPGQGADSRHLLCLLQVSFKLFAMGDVKEHGQDDGLAGNPDQLSEKKHIDHLAIPSPEFSFLFSDLPRFF